MSKENINKSIKDKLHFICDKIEQVLKEYHESYEQDRLLKQTQDIYNLNNGSKINTIKNLKQNVSLIQNNLEKIYDIGKINKIESEIKKKISTLNQLTKEQNLLCNLVQKQQESIDDYSSKFTTNKEISEIRDKLQYAKEENHMNRETYKLYNSKIKGQLSKIDVLDKKSKIIRQNIEFQQRKQKKEVEKSMNGGENEEEYEENNMGENELDCLLITEKMLMLEIEQEEKNFKSEINLQNEVIEQILRRINDIKNRKNELQQRKKENDILKKIKIIKSKEKNKRKKNMHSNDKNNNNKINYKSNDYQNNINKTNKNILKYAETPKNKNDVMTIFTTNKSNSKPCDIRKFNLNNNNTLSNKQIYTSMYNFNKDIKMSNNENIINKKISPLKEIEQLQNDIKNALKNNIAIINTGKSNNNIIANEHKSNNDNLIGIGQSSDINNKKNKPFEKFIFN